MWSPFPCALSITLDSTTPRLLRVPMNTHSSPYLGTKKSMLSFLIPDIRRTDGTLTWPRLWGERKTRCSKVKGSENVNQSKSDLRSSTLMQKVTNSSHGSGPSPGTVLLDASLHLTPPSLQSPLPPGSVWESVIYIIWLLSGLMREYVFSLSAHQIVKFNTWLWWWW